VWAIRHVVAICRGFPNEAVNSRADRRQFFALTRQILASAAYLQRVLSHGDAALVRQIVAFPPVLCVSVRKIAERRIRVVNVCKNLIPRCGFFALEGRCSHLYGHRRHREKNDAKKLAPGRAAVPALLGIAGCTTAPPPIKGWRLDDTGKTGRRWSRPFFLLRKACACALLTTAFGIPEAPKRA
jgi:hypothetical protein